MQFNIVSVSGGEFKDEKSSKTIHYGSVMVIGDEIIQKDGFSGQEVRKIKAAPDLIHHIKNDVPAQFECRIDIVGKDSQVKIVSAKKVK